MSTTIILTLCTVLLLAYAFEVSTRFTRIPAVIWLLVLGWCCREIVHYFGIVLPDFRFLLPVFGTIGLILIVLEGALDITVNRSKLTIIRKALVAAIVPMFLLSFALALVWQWYSGCSFRAAIINAIPFAVISSAIAIPSARGLTAANREFITYESSLSDILGVLLFNFLAFNETINGKAFGTFSIQLVMIIVISFIAVVGLAILLSRIKHHVTYTPIILLVLLIYSLSKVIHLPGLLFILVFGLFLGNLDEVKHSKWIKAIRPDVLDKEVDKFKEITIEATFLIRALFFILFGYLLETSEFLNLETLPFAFGITVGVLLVRWVILRLSRLPVLPLLFIAPRGLITILLFLSILPQDSIPIVNPSLLIQTILLTVGAMMIGFLFYRPAVTEIEL